MSPSVPAVIKSSTSTQAELVPSTSSVTVASPSISQPPTSVIDTAPTTSHSLSISAASSSSTACSVLETTTTTSNTIPTKSQDTTQTSKPRRKKHPPKNQSTTINPSGGSPSLGEYGFTLPRCPSDLFLFPRGLLSLVNTSFTNPGNPSDPSLFSALFLAIQISLFFFSRPDHRPTLDNEHCPNLILF
ncbi:hypothetical protein TNCV_3531751 [Trichonephila clavipes]|nr:hypothetical protein TNCV_3531751 [Trichonephila clavipes]